MFARTLLVRFHQQERCTPRAPRVWRSRAGRAAGSRVLEMESPLAAPDPFAHVRIGKCEHRCPQLQVVESDVDVRARQHRFRKRLLDAIESDETQLVPEGARGIEVPVGDPNSSK